MPKKEQTSSTPETGLQCRCGLIVPRHRMDDYLCPECRLARTLTGHDRARPAIARPVPYQRSMKSARSQRICNRLK